MKHPRRYLVSLSLCALGALTYAPRAHAVWPPPEDITRDQAAMPEFWPNDPDYNGDWNFWSWVPAVNLALPGFHTHEASLGTGMSLDRAWGISTGDPHVLIAVLDSGIRWHKDEVQVSCALNTHELPLPEGATSYDANGDGAINVLDYLNDSRVPCGTTLPHPLRACTDAAGNRNDPNGNGMFDAGDLIRVFSDGVDDDANGYKDDIAGWDFYKDDNDPFDDTDFGHGTGEAGDSTALGNDGVGNIGACPFCQFVPVRVGDSFVAKVSDFAQGVIYATDADYGQGRRIHVVQEALGTMDNNRFAAEAIDYAYNHGLIVVASMADENARHPNEPAVNNHVVAAHAVTHNENDVDRSTTFMAFNNCTNYGGHQMLSVSGDSCSSEATGKASGIAGLIYSTAMQRGLNPALSAEEVRQLLIMTVDDINEPTSIPGAPNYDSTLYPSLPGWDQRFGYGRVNARTALEAVRDGKIPPEVDIVSPRWYRMFDPSQPRDRTLRIEGTINARRAPSFDYVVEWAKGIEPADADFTTLRAENNVTAALTSQLADLDLSSVDVHNAGEKENQFTITVRVRAVAHYGGTAGDVRGEARRVFYVHRDPDLLPGFPVEFDSSDEGSPHLADLDGDGTREIVVATSGGELHALRADGTELPGFPVHTALERGYDPGDPNNYLNAPAYRGTSPAIDASRVYDAIMGAPAVADLDGDSHPEIVLASLGGTVYVFRHDGTPYGHGFPRALPDVPSAQTAPNRKLDRGAYGAPVIYDLNNDGTPEIVLGAFDGKVYAIDTTTAADRPGFPVTLEFPDPNAEYGRIFAPVGVGKVDGDNIPDIVAVSSGRVMRNNGAAYVIHGDGNNHAGGPFHPNWPVTYDSQNVLPVIGEGITIAPALADVDHDGLDEIALTGTASLTTSILRGAQGPHQTVDDPATLNNLTFIDNNQRGHFSDFRQSSALFGAVISAGTFADMTNDGTLEFMISGANLGLVSAISGGKRKDAFHMLHGWDAVTGDPMPGFPRVINDFTMFQNPAAVDVTGDGYPEALVATAGFFLYAFDACGHVPEGFPKFSGQWMAASPAVGDLDQDGALELVDGTRSGYVYAWRTRGRSDGSVQWASYRHDNANTGNYGTALDFGVRRVTGVDPIVCAAPDAGVADAGGDGSALGDGAAGDGAMQADAGMDGGPYTAGGGCGCRTPAGVPNGRSAGIALGAVAGAAALASRRRRRGSRARG